LSKETNSENQLFAPVSHPVSSAHHIAVQRFFVERQNVEQQNVERQNVEH
jgi:hypothetical protein